MKTKIISFYSLKKSLWVILLISSLALVSCTGKILRANSKAEKRLNYMQSYKRSIYGAQTTLSPYTKEYRDYLQKKYFGRLMNKKVKNEPIVDNTK